MITHSGIIAQEKKGKKTREKWNRLLSYTAANRQDHRKRRGSQKGDQKEEAGPVRSGRYDYKKFLRQFSVLREEVELDTESFDYIFYNYGMEHYGNLPLIEPLEYKEVNRLEELVIAIDTSGSCDGETVRRFLGETYAILAKKRIFSSRMKVYIVQCDCCIQKVDVIHSEEEWKKYSKDIIIQGRGGTDFRPVFRYVKEQQEKKEIRRLKALIYFTDGDGIYPGRKPDYETAFVFLKNRKDGAGAAMGDPACGRAGRSALQNMNIKEAKEEIKHTLLAYNRKDVAGRYTFPKLRQRPILLMGPPGIGKTAIMEQVAEECGVGLVAYTITHHTRQSAVGLPRIVTRCYNGKEVSITEYTLSEIIASVYDCMERTGKKEGILFIDEINCVSETLAPTMLQFLQNKMFGSHSVPEDG